MFSHPVIVKSNAAHINTVEDTPTLQNGYNMTDKNASVLTSRPNVIFVINRLKLQSRVNKLNAVIKYGPIFTLSMPQSYLILTSPSAPDIYDNLYRHQYSSVKMRCVLISEVLQSGLSLTARAVKNNVTLSLLLNCCLAANGPKCQ